jgi:hypothetical protein
MIRAFLAVELSGDLRNRIARIQQELKTSLARELRAVISRGCDNSPSAIKFLAILTADH